MNYYKSIWTKCKKKKTTKKKKRKKKSSSYLDGLRRDSTLFEDFVEP